MIVSNKLVYGMAGILTAATALSACEVDGSTGGIANRDIIGGAGGAAVGLIACQIFDAGTLGCALATLGGAAAGVFVGRRLLDDDKEPRAGALADVVDGNRQSADWRNAETGSSGTISLAGNTTGPNGETCRIIDETYTIRGSAPITEQFTLCPTGNGEWRTVT
ncbi:MAG: RT0821/Lpp0805 family surface protein [Pseudomonadota bacterium]